MLRSDNYQISIPKKRQNSLQNNFPLNVLPMLLLHSEEKRLSGIYDPISAMLEEGQSNNKQFYAPQDGTLYYDTEGAYKSEN